MVFTPTPTYPIHPYSAIISGGDVRGIPVGPGNDFFANSGLDHFYIEELEREYFQINQLDAEQLQKLRTGTL